MRRLWRGETVNAEIGHQRLVGSHLRSAAGSIPIFVSASGPRTIETAGRHADGVLMLVGLWQEPLERALEQLEQGRRDSTVDRFETACCLYGAVDDDETAAIEAARAIVAWLAKASPPAARAAGMSEDLIDLIDVNYSGREFQEARRAAAVVPDAVVQQVAFAGGRKYAEGQAGLARVGRHRHRESRAPGRRSSPDDRGRGRDRRAGGRRLSRDRSAAWPSAEASDI